MKTIKGLAVVAALLVPSLAKAVTYKITNNSKQTVTFILTGGSHNEPPFVGTIEDGKTAQGQRDCTQSITIQPVSENQIIQNPMTIGIPNQVCHHDWGITLDPSIPVNGTNLNPPPFTGIRFNVNSFMPD